MNKKHVAIGVIAVIILAGVVWFLNPLGRVEHIESHNASYQDFRFDTGNFKGNVTVQFANDPTLLYSIDVTLKAGPVLNYYQTYSFIPDSGLRFTDTSVIESLNITCGNRIPYSFYFSSGNSQLDVKFYYDNNAVIDGQSVSVQSHRGDVEFYFTENVNVTGDDIDVYFEGFSDLLFDIDLPTGLEGSLAMSSNTDYIISENTGWLPRPEAHGVKYGTTTDSSLPSIDIVVHLGTVTAYLKT